MSLSFRPSDETVNWSDFFHNFLSENLFELSYILYDTELNICALKILLLNQNSTNYNNTFCALKTSCYSPKLVVLENQSADLQVQVVRVQQVQVILQ